MSKEQTKWRQAFYEDIQPIRLKDPLAYVLGSQGKDDTFVFNFSDCVLLAGHSCPAVSGAYMVTAKALKALYGDQLPVRGEIKVLIKGGPRDLAYGPQAQVISFITGAAGVTGFGGLGGRYSRSDRLFFDSKDPQFNTFIFQREDTGKTVKVTYNPQGVPQDPRLNDLIQIVLSGMGSDAEQELFGDLWQEKVRKILLEDDQYPGIFEVEDLKDFKFPAAEAGAL